MLAWHVLAVVVGVICMQCSAASASIPTGFALDAGRLRIRESANLGCEDLGLSLQSAKIRAASPGRISRLLHRSEEVCGEVEGPQIHLDFAEEQNVHKEQRVTLAQGGRCLQLRGGGLLVVGTPLSFGDSLQYLGYVREHGILQFIHMYNANKDRSNEKLLWGEELEYHVLKVDRKERRVRLSLRATEILDLLNEREDKNGRSDNRKEACAWHPEYGSWMVEGTPRLPFGGFVRDLRRVEASLRLRRRRLLAALQEDEILPTVTAFPIMGTEDFTWPPTQPRGPVAMSEGCSDEMINPHPRFATLTANIRQRRGDTVRIKVPLYIDKNTIARLEEEEKQGIGPADPHEIVEMSGLNKERAMRETITMDSMAYGMGMSCLQVTFQTRDVAESRHLYDQLAVLTPIMLALSAATPILKGRLADTDVRWATIAASVDDRTPQERGKAVCAPSHKGKLGFMAGSGQRPLNKSRYESISSYICNCKGGQENRTKTDKYNDIACPIDETAYSTLTGAGIDQKLARHIAHLFVRDPLVIFSERIHIPDTTESDHFENIQSTNWQTVRWKPPPANSKTGWRVEFRSMEAQLTDFDNAAFTVLTVLISRVLLAFKLNLYMPLSQVDSNMQVAHERNAAVEGRFWFRKHMAEDEAVCPEGHPQDECELMSVYEILTGKGDYFPGLLPLCFAYLDHVGCDTATRDTIRQYAMVLEKRAKGELMTAATWIRDFVHKHPEYKSDSVVPHGVAFDLMQACADVGEGRRPAPELLGKVIIEPLTPDKAYEVPLDAAPFDEEQRRILMSKYTLRAKTSKESGTTISDGWTTPIAETMEKLEHESETNLEGGVKRVSLDASMRGCRGLTADIRVPQGEPAQKAFNGLQRVGSRGVQWAEDDSSDEEVSHVIQEDEGAVSG